MIVLGGFLDINEYKQIYSDYSALKDQLLDITDTASMKEQRALAVKIETLYKKLVIAKRDIVNQRNKNALFKSKQ